MGNPKKGTKAYQAKLKQNADYKAKKRLHQFLLQPRTRRLMAEGARAAALKLKSRLEQAAKKHQTDADNLRTLWVMSKFYH